MDFDSKVGISSWIENEYNMFNLGYEPMTEWPEEDADRHSINIMKWPKTYWRKFVYWSHLYALKYNTK